MFDLQLDRLLADPKVDPLELGLALLECERSESFPHGCRTSRDLIRHYSHLDFSKVRHWMNAAAVLDGPGDPNRAWGISCLIEIARLKDPTVRAQFFQQHTPGRLTVREVRASVRALLGRTPLPQSPHTRLAIMQRTIEGYLQRQDVDPELVNVRVELAPRDALVLRAETDDPVSAQAAELAARALGEVAIVRAAWEDRSWSDASPQPWRMPLAELDELPVGPLQVKWGGPDQVEVSRGGQLILRLPVVREKKSKLVKTEGNRKTRDRYAIINCIHHGCLRRGTGLPRCEDACYLEPGVSRGCFANLNEFAGERAARDGYDVATNGVTNDYLRVRLPSDRNADLRQCRPRRQSGEPPIYRVDGESADGAMSIGLGILQMWAERNANLWFTTICSDAVAPSDVMLCWLAELRNVFAVGHTVAGWFSREELDQRFHAIQRFIGFGIPTTIWITTHRGWDNGTILNRALDLVPPEQIIEYPLRTGSEQELPLLHVNPDGACGDYREGRGGKACRVHYDEDAAGVIVPRLVNENGREQGDRTPHARCRGCRLRCGFTTLVR